MRLHRSGLIWLLALAICALQTGCVQRRLTIRSNPPGALVYVDDEPLGTSVGFGDRVVSEHFRSKLL